MKELFLEIYSDVDLDGVCETSIETVIILFLLEYLEYPPIPVTFVIGKPKLGIKTFSVKISELLFEVIELSDCNTLAQICKFPLIITNDGTTCVGGLCSMLRQVVKSVDPKHTLLGFKQSCLYACAESSIWTKYCEVDITNTVNDMLNMTICCQNVEIPSTVVRFENHMSQPVRIHNIQKQKQNVARMKGFKKTRLPDSRLDLIQDLHHTYAEGPDMSLADIILFPCLHIVLQTIESVFLRQHLSLTYAWYDNLLRDKDFERCLKILINIEKKLVNEVYVNYNIPEVTSVSLYKSDPKRYKPKNRIYTKQEDIAVSLGIVDEMNLNIKIDEWTFGHDVKFDWETVPYHAQPEAGQLPEKRLERKAQQLENMTKAVLKIAKQGDVIVDFCSGSGHLGLILAHFLPRCTVILLENKEESLGRARVRSNQLKLTNIIYCQSNLDYFIGKFNIGVSLHACGVATDLVISRCIQQNASFICCPCCYGNIQNNHITDYPRSLKFKQSALSYRDYLVVCHASDQTHDELNVKTNQGNTCMNIIDTDRKLYGEEAGYNVSLSKLSPLTCTPKHNLLVGIYNVIK